MYECSRKECIFITKHVFAWVGCDPGQTRDQQTETTDTQLGRPPNGTEVDGVRHGDGSRVGEWSGPCSPTMEHKLTYCPKFYIVPLNGMRVNP